MGVHAVCIGDGQGLVTLGTLARNRPVGADR
jgi:hypothetical protein